MALSKKKRVGKRTIAANQVRKTASGRKRRKSDGTQPPKADTPTPKPAASRRLTQAGRARASCLA
jgi:hypothetical protein